MAASFRFIQVRNYIGLQLLADADGISEFDFTIGPSTDTPAATFSLSNDTSGRAPESPLDADAAVAAVNASEGTTSLDIEFDMDAGKSFPVNTWTTIVWMEHDQAVGASAFDAPITVTKIEDGSGAAIAANNYSDLTTDYQHVPPTTAQNNAADLLESLGGQMGYENGDYMGEQTLFQQKRDSVPSFTSFHTGIMTGPQAIEDINTLLTAGFVSRGNGANMSQFNLLEAGKRSLGFPIS